ncbi:MAG: helix-turn-helix domain-containing protein, partial [Anaerolineae bacterium]|nr:helix-turn-helix domain-containing protein [Anaerolineae bacterium]
MREALKDTPIRKQPDYEGIGEMLRDFRESIGVTLPQAARDLHIKQSYLIALEEGKLEVIPGGAYAKGYMKKYAAYLG